jgi:hypothetical protein
LAHKYHVSNSPCGSIGHPPCLLNSISQR